MNDADPDYYSQAHRLLHQDPFSTWMGIKILSAAVGECRLACTVRPEFRNGLGVAHGAIAFGLADTALAFASNQDPGSRALSLDGSISYLKPLQVGDQIEAHARSLYQGRTIGHYEVNVFLSSGALVAVFSGKVFRKPL